MKGSSNDNGKVSDSGYANTYVTSQRGSGSSLSRNSNRSESSGYCGGHPSTFDSSNYALPQPISKHSGKGHKKKKSKTATTTSLAIVNEKLGSQIDSGNRNEVGTYDSNGSSSDLTSNCKKSEEVACVELVDGTGLGEHNGDSNSTEPKGGVGTNTNPLDDTSSNTNAGFCAVISMKKGLVINVTPSVKTALGYTKESWIGRSFIDFVHPKDKHTFADLLVKNIALPFEDRDNGTSGRQTSMFCNLLKYNEGRSSTMGSASDESNSIAATATHYLPFHLTTSFKFYHERTCDEKPRMMFLTVNADRIMPVYKGSEEMIISTIFSTHHDRSCILTHVDLNVVQYFGYMPQDMLGHSLFEFYHPEDLPFLKEVYETVVKMEGSPFRSKPYRFAAQNGDYVVLETEWSSFVNPWKGQLEFVVGHHRILRGPANPNVFQPRDDCQRTPLANISEEIIKESKIIQGEIRALLDEKVPRTEDNDAYTITSRSKDLDTFVENLMRKAKPSAQGTKKRLPADNRSFSEHDSVILGAISPHHEYCDSKSSSETPPSYNQLNYHEKITRFFDSQFFVTTTYGSDEDNHNLSVPSNEDAAKTSSDLNGTKPATLSAENLSSGSNNRTSYDSRDDSDNARSANTMPAESVKLPSLTTSVLNKHNQKMEKLLVQQHKERRCNIKDNNKHQKDSRHKITKDKTEKHATEQKKHGGSKRRSTNGREGEQCKISKTDHHAQTGAVAFASAMSNTTMNVDDNSSAVQQTCENTRPHVCTATQNRGMHEGSIYPEYSPFVPIYYVALPHIRENFVQATVPSSSSLSFQNRQTQQNNFVSYVAAPLTGMVYSPMVCAPSSAPTMDRSFVIPGPVPVHRETPQSNLGVAQQENCSEHKQPESQATSIKAEPGSIMAMSESSKKLFSLGEHFSSCVSIDGGCSSVVPNTKRETNTNSQFESSLEDSSDSSFYGSFLTTSNGSSCTMNQKHVPNVPEAALWKPMAAPHTNSDDKKQLNMLRKGPPWQEDVKMTHELIYQYQVTPKPLNEVLEADMKALKKFHQPQMVNDQLAQLYSDMELDGFHAKLVLADGEASSDSESRSSGDNPRNIMPEPKRVNNEMNYTMLTMIYEENAPLSSP